MRAKGVCAALAIFSILNVAAIAQSTPGGGSFDRSNATPPKEVGRPNKINLNTAPIEELRKLPRLNPESVTAIVEARKKSKFKDWNDFAGRRLVPHFAHEEIKDRVTF